MKGVLGLYAGSPSVMSQDWQVNWKLGFMCCYCCLENKFRGAALGGEE